MKLCMGVLVLFLTGCSDPNWRLTVYYPAAPNGTWWKKDSSGGYLIDEKSGIKISAFGGGTAFLYQCGNDELTFKTDLAAAQAAVACAAQYESSVQNDAH